MNYIEGCVLFLLYTFDFNVANFVMFDGPDGQG